MSNNFIEREFNDNELRSISELLANSTNSETKAVMEEYADSINNGDYAYKGDKLYKRNKHTGEYELLTRRKMIKDAFNNTLDEYREEEKAEALEKHKKLYGNDDLLDPDEYRGKINPYLEYDPKKIDEMSGYKLFILRQKKVANNDPICIKTVAKWNGEPVIWYRTYEGAPWEEYTWFQAMPYLKSRILAGIGLFIGCIIFIYILSIALPIIYGMF